MSVASLRLSVSVIYPANNNGCNFSISVVLNLTLEK